jgi:hypothetical protein
VPAPTRSYPRERVLDISIFVIRPFGLAESSAAPMAPSLVAAPNQQQTNSVGQRCE